MVSQLEVQGNKQWLFIVWMDGTTPDISPQGDMHTLKLEGDILVKKWVVFEMKEKSKEFSLYALMQDHDLSKQQMIHS